MLDGLDLDIEVLYVDDGSRDDTYAIMCALRAADPRVSTLKLSRNFGKELALTAGLDHVDADAAVVIDADLQDPPELIPTFVAHWREGYDVVYGTRASRAGETGFKKMTASAFLPRDGKALADADSARHRRFPPALAARARCAEAGARAPAFHERSFHLGRLPPAVGRLSPRSAPRRRRPNGTTGACGTSRSTGITSFSDAPLKLATYVGLATAVLAFVFGLWVLGKALWFGDPVRGYPSLMVVVLFLGGVQLIALGVIGEYLGRLYVESKQRPLYLVDEYHPPHGGG